MMSICSALRSKQKEHLINALLCLHQYSIYALIDSSLAVPGEIDNIIKDLTVLIEEEYSLE